MDRSVHILLVEDNPADARLVQEAFRSRHTPFQLNVVEDGEEALAYLQNLPPFPHVVRPDLIVLDLNLPRKDGREVLAQIKADEDLRRIPVVVLTTSNADEDVLRAYDLHANSYVSKPLDFDDFIRTAETIERFWLTTVTLPPN